jgi:hypothetical protein
LLAALILVGLHDVLEHVEDAHSTQAERPFRRKPNSDST